MWKQLIFVWQYSFANEPPFAIAKRLQTLSFDSVAVKAFDGLDWMAKFDSSTYAIDNVHRLIKQTKIYEQHGLKLVPWGVPHGNIDRRSEVALAASIAEACKEIIIDAEPYDRFWQASWESFAEYLTWLREAAPDAIIHVTFDAPYRDYSRIKIDRWSHLVNGYLMPQDYWTDFEEPPYLVLQRSTTQLETLGNICHVLPANAPISEIIEVAQFIQRRVALWSLHNLTDEIAYTVRKLMEDTDMNVEQLELVLEDLNRWYAIQSPAKNEIEHLRDVHGSTGARAVADAAKYAILAKQRLEQLIDQLRK